MRSFKITKTMWIIGILTVGLTLMALNIVVGASRWYLYIGLGLIAIFIWLKLIRKKR